MNLIEIKEQRELRYPIGNHIIEALEFINRLRDTIKELDSFPKDDIMLWCRGSSGSILASMFSMVLIANGAQNISIFYVNKDGEYRHQMSKQSPKKYNIIIDDFIASGATMYHIAKRMHMCKVKYIDYMIVSNAIPLYRTWEFPVPKNMITGTDAIENCINEVKKLKPSNLKKYDFT